MDSYSKEMLRQQVSRMTEKNMFEFCLFTGILDNRVTATEDQWQKGVYHRQISDRYRQISGEVFVLIFMRNSTSFSRQKMGAIKEKCRQSITLLEKFTKFLMKKKCLCYFIALSKNYFLQSNYISFTFLSKYFEGKHLTRLTICIFFPPRLINDVAFTLCKHWNLSLWNWLWYNWCSKFNYHCSSN